MYVNEGVNFYLGCKAINFSCIIVPFTWMFWLAEPSGLQRPIKILSQPSLCSCIRGWQFWNGKSLPQPSRIAYGKFYILMALDSKITRPVFLQTTRQLLLNILYNVKKQRLFPSLLALSMSQSMYMWGGKFQTHWYYFFWSPNWRQFSTTLQNRIFP